MINLIMWLLTHWMCWLILFSIFIRISAKHFVGRKHLQICLFYLCRQKREEEERKKLGEDNIEEEEEEDIVNGNPWKRLDSEEIKRKVLTPIMVTWLGEEAVLLNLYIIESSDFALAMFLHASSSSYGLVFLDTIKG